MADTAAALWTRHRSVALAVARDFYLPGADPDDVRQEALIGLWEAARHYRPERGPFAPFARLVVKRALVNRLRTARSPRHRALTDAARDLEHRAALTDDPVEQRETMRELTRALAALNDADRDAIRRIVDGIPLAGKADDNARYNARRRLRAALRARQAPA